MKIRLGLRQLTKFNRLLGDVQNAQNVLANPAMKQ